MTIGDRRRRRGLAALLVLSVAAAGCSASAHRAGTPVGSAPASAFAAPGTPEIVPDSVLTGTVESPALTVEGDTVLADLGAGRRVRIEVVGPVVPGEGLPYQPAATTCTWTITLSGASADVPLALKAFSTLDDQGSVYPLRFVAGHIRAPAVLAPGRRTSFEVRTLMRTGEGVLRWAPNGRIVAMWDFTVETD